MGLARRSGSGERVRWKEADARKFLREWRRSGLSLPAHCRVRGVGYERVRRWQVKLGEREAERPIELRRVELTDAQPGLGSQDTRLEILLRSGHELRIPARFDVGAVRTLVGILEGR